MPAVLAGQPLPDVRALRNGGERWDDDRRVSTRSGRSPGIDSARGRNGSRQTRSSGECSMSSIDHKVTSEMSTREKLIRYHLYKLTDDSPRYLDESKVRVMAERQAREELEDDWRMSRW